MPKACTQVYQCESFANKLSDLLTKNGVDHEVLEVESDYGVYSDKGGLISTNGTHYGVQVGGDVYDNMTPSGMPRAEWEHDLGIGVVDGIRVK